MVILILILVPLAALFMYAVVSRRRGAVRGHDISSTVRTARADAEARIDSPHGVGGVGGIGGAIGSWPGL